MNVVYSIESGKLVVRNKDTRVLMWESDFGGAEVYKILPLEHEEGCIVLLDPGSSKQPTFENLLLVSPSGDVRWKAQLPRTNDAFADILMTEQQLEARTWTGIRVRVDITTGRTLEIGFSK